ncbi:transmembrane protein [Perilla frutescens var. hirtella]|uniref:Transmembrane protein n=1 Tax=Perilla frutescens var. hirtella TaxID=608512 RepID=A0AAD4NY64_PERFH|nr:transmembrane protein [Perilla frutescens var. hirtella]
MSMHAKTDSEVTSLAPSSPNRAVYYVQSPSRDSHDGEKTTNSFHSTPILSPMGSPGRQSRDSSSTRYSGSLKPGSQKSSNGSRRHHHHHRKAEKEWKEFDAIEEEGLLDEEGGRRGLPRRCYFLAFVVGFFVLFSFFALILWGASRNQKPVVTMKSIFFENFVINAGSDASGVSTEMITMNSTVKLLFRNRGTFFGVHVTSTPLDLSSSQLTIATGAINRFYESRSSQRTVTVMVRGSSIPLYGGGADLGSKDGKPVLPVPLVLNFTVRARAYILGQLVKPKFYKRVQCSLVLDPKKMNVAIPLKNSCTYT